MAPPTNGSPAEPANSGKRPAAPPFDAKAFLEAVGDERDALTCKAGETIFSQGDDAEAVLFLQRGRVKLTTISTHGKEAIIALLDAGNFFGEGCLAGQTVRMSTASAMLDSTIVRVQKAVMVRLLQERPAFSEIFIAHLLLRNIRIEEDLVDQLFNSSEKRLARVLLLLANFGKDGKPEPIIANISQETLAEMIGTTRSRVSHFMNKFRQMGFIDYNGHLEIHSSLLSVVLNDQKSNVVAAPRI